MGAHADPLVEIAAAPATTVVETPATEDPTASWDLSFYECDLCQKVFNPSENLKKHRLTHGNGNKMPYECDLCQKVFNPSEDFKEHRLTHQKIRGC